MNSWRRISGTFVLMILLSLLAGAQDQPPLRGKAAERLEQYKKVRLMEALKLDEETSIRFFARYNKHMETLKDIGQERNVLTDRLQAVVDGKGGDQEIDRTIQGLLALEGRIGDSRKAFLGELKEILTTRQIAQYILFERDFNRNLREALREMTQGRWDRRLP